MTEYVKYANGRGLALVDPKRRKEIAAMGGRSSRGGGRPKGSKDKQPRKQHNPHNRAGNT